MQEERTMEYNSLREKLIIPEYGRNFQKLVRHAPSITDLNERQLYVERLVELICQMNPQSKNLLEFRERVWGHVFVIGGYDLNVMPPNGVVPTVESENKKPNKVEYPENNRKFRHYGNHVNTLFAKAIAMEDGPKKEAFVELIANFMKIAYKNWNREHYVSDEIIKGDIVTMTDGKLTLPEDLVLVTLPASASGPSNSSSRGGKPKRKSNNNGKGRSNNNRGKSSRYSSGGSNNNRRR